MTPDQAIEAELVAKGKTAPRIKPEDIEANIASEFYFLASEGVQGEALLGTRPALWTGLDMVTICAMVLKNGHRIIGVNTGPVSHANFDADMGKRFARQNAVDQIWPLMGFALRQSEHERAVFEAGPRTGTGA